MKKKILILCGGPSTEHEISIRSAYNIYKHLDTHLFTPLLVGMSRAKNFYTLTFTQLEELYINFGCITDNLYPPADLNKMVIDVCFPVLHGAGGEDGCIQGYLEVLNIPYVGNGVAASAICMDKDITKRLLQSHDLPVVPFLTIKQADEVSYAVASQKLGSTTLFLKCVNQGSSIGTYKVRSEQEYNECLQEAFTFGPKVLIEKAIQGREIECAVIGNTDPETSVFGEIIPQNNHEFYDYNAKYIDADGAKLTIDAPLNDAIKKQLSRVARKAFKALDCAGLARIDFFVDAHDTIFINEINTMPGFTNISMYPQLVMHSGIKYQDIVTRLIHLAQEHSKKNI
ncbi:MAG TPA: D-alanine--D-alanine ligase A [Holosporales bacterium]|nr:D-alanine--D-alanine ligase A [Holosporales bacterium]